MRLAWSQKSRKGLAEQGDRGTESRTGGSVFHRSRGEGGRSSTIRFRRYFYPGWMRLGSEPRKPGMVEVDQRGGDRGDRWVMRRRSRVRETVTIARSWGSERRVAIARIAEDLGAIAGWRGVCDREDDDHCGGDRGDRGVRRGRSWVRETDKGGRIVGSERRTGSWVLGEFWGRSEEIVGFRRLIEGVW